MSSALIPLTSTAQRMGARMVEALCRLGFEHKNLDGRIFRPTFSAIDLYIPYWAVYEIDAQRLWHFSIADLATDKVTAQLSAVLRKPVKALNRNGLFYVVELEPYKPQVQRLPNKAALDLEERPAGDLLVPIGVGRGGPIWHALPDLGHCLVTGATGSGKSMFLHCSLAALLTSVGPDRLRVVLVDPKRSELTLWANAPHLVGDVAYSEAQATDALADVVEEIEQRSDLFAQAGCRHFAAYNRQASDPLPVILVVIDEALDLVLNAGKRSLVVGHIKSIAILGRAAGVYLWLATQHAAAVTGLPRVATANLATRIVFRVADMSAAAVAGCDGAERIPRDKPGRMLAKVDGEPVELQGHYLPDEALAVIAAGQAGRAAGSQLSDVERALVAYAQDNLAGAFTVARLAESGIMSKRAITKLAQRWERRGWLTSPASVTESRYVTPALAAIAGDTVRDAAFIH